MSLTDWRYWSALFAATIFLSHSAAAADECDSSQDPEAAIVDCTQSINSGKWKGSHLAAFYTNRAAAYQAKGDNDRAMADLNEAIRLDPKLAMALNNRGAAYNEQGDNDRAIADYDAAIRIDPKFAMAFQNRGNAYHDKGDLDRAIADYNVAIRLDPKFATAFQNRAGAYHDKGDNDRAVADYGEAIRLDPKRVKAFVGRGMAFRAKGDNDRAITDYSEALRLDPKRVGAFLGRGLAYRAKGDSGRAIADFNEAIRLDPKEANAFVIRGIAYHAKGDDDRAMADYNEAIRLDPKSYVAYVLRGRSYFFAGSAEKALADLSRASANAPEDAYSALWLDIVSRRNNLPSRLAQASSKVNMTVWPAPVIRLFMDQMTPADVLAAIDDLDAAKKKDKVCEVHFYSGELALTKGSKDEATRLFRQVVSDCPQDFDERDAVIAELKALGAARERKFLFAPDAVAGAFCKTSDHFTACSAVVKTARSARAVSSGTSLGRSASCSMTRARSCGRKKSAQTSRVSRIAAATRRALAGLPPLSITEQMASRMYSAMFLRMPAYACSRTRVSCSGASPARDIFIETAMRA